MHTNLNVLLLIFFCIRVCPPHIAQYRRRMIRRRVEVMSDYSRVYDIPPLSGAKKARDTSSSLVRTFMLSCYAGTRTDACLPHVLRRELPARIHIRVRCIRCVAFLAGGRQRAACCRLSSPITIRAHAGWCKILATPTMFPRVGTEPIANFSRSVISSPYKNVVIDGMMKCNFVGLFAELVRTD